MNPTWIRRVLLAALAATLFASCGFFAPMARADQWIQPTKEELAMTSQPQVPGAPAVYLDREESTLDNLHVYSEYVRIKVLTDGGKKYANVELKYVAGGAVHFTVDEVAGRTIHPDGTIIPFSGKPYDQLIVRSQGYSEKAKVFTLPDVTVGSIIEYRYKLRWNDNYYVPPHWEVQNQLYLRKGHFLWKPTDKQLMSSDERGQLTQKLAWSPILPAGAEIKQSRLPDSGTSGFSHEALTLELDVHDVPPAPEEEYMLPMSSFSYRVLFYYTGYNGQEDFWKNEGKHWAKINDKFIGHGPIVQQAVQELVAPTDTQEQKLRKLYAAVMRLDNADFNREHSREEDKAEGLSEIKTTDDIWTRKRGSGKEIAALFVAMARAAGMKAYLMAVTNRDRSIFYPGFESLEQLDDEVAIVTVDGKDQFFDPGSRYCPYGHLDWKHAMAGGLRQTEDGAAQAQAPAESYLSSGVDRVANLTLDQHGTAAGTIKLTFHGESALAWRQRSLTGDPESLEHELTEDLEHMLPGGMDVKISTIDKLADYEAPLVVSYSVKGAIGSPAGKRLLITGDLFETNTKPAFVHEKRETAIAFHYASSTRDAVRINFPAGFEIESSPASSQIPFQKFAVYSLKTEPAPTSITIRRNLLVSEILYMQKEYPDLRTFYSKFETADQEPIVLKVTPSVAGN
jgi:Domain of Unknown Function with PDB structure (DUF3857)/Transglutaminase-like superfamily